MSHAFVPGPDSTEPLQWWRYTHTSVRDLAWLLGSPALFCERLGNHDTLDLAFDPMNGERWLQQLDEQLQGDSGTCTIPRRQAFRRLGLYCEALLAYYFEHAKPHRVSAWRLLARNVQTHHQGHTLGELDYVLEDGVLEDGRQHVVHLELAVKFYLQVENGSGAWADWVGPNAVDRLDIKLHRMLEHQLTLPQKISAKKAVTEHDCLAQISCSRQLIKGVNFIHFNRRNTPLRPDFASDSMLWGHWMRLTEFKNYAYDHAPLYSTNPSTNPSPNHSPNTSPGLDRIAAFHSGVANTPTTAQAVLCDKLEWLTGPESTATGCTLERLVPALDAIYARAKHMQRKPPGLQVMIRHSASDTPGEVERIMIVPDGWPIAVR